VIRSEYNNNMILLSTMHRYH